MTKRGTLGLRVLWVLAPMALAVPGVAAAPSAADGWERLWRNRNVEARAAFRAALKQNPSDGEAPQGLGLLNLQEDAEVSALQAWRPLYRLAPAHWAATAYWPRMVELARRTGRWGLLEGAARDVLASSKAPPELRASARLVLADAADRGGQSALAQQQWAAMGYVRRWWVIGPFDNTSRSGFDKVYPPEREIDLTKSYPGVDELPLRWHRLALVTRDGQCAVGASLGDSSANVFYAVTALFSPREQEAVLRLDPTGASQVMVNGRPVLTGRIYRQRQPLCADPLSAPVTLRAGWNTVLIKLADDDHLLAAFSLRVTSASGEVLKGIKADPAVLENRGAAVDGAAAVAPAPEAAPAEPWSVARLREAGGGAPIERAAALADHLRRARDYEAAAAVLREALLRAPSAGWLHWELSQVLREDQQLDEARAARDLARKNNPRLVDAELQYLEDQGDALPAAQRVRHLRSLLKINPQSAEVLWRLAAACEEAGLTGEALKAARATAASRAGLDHLQALVLFYQRHDRPTEAARALALAQRAAPNSEALLLSRIETHTEQRKHAAAVTLYQRLLRINPAEPSYRLQLVQLYWGMRQLGKAARQLQIARGQQPQDATLCATLARLLREMGRRKEAIDLFRVAIRLDHTRADLREQLRLLLGEPPVVDRAPATPVTPILAQTPRAADLPGVPAVVLLDELREVVYPDCTSVMHARYIVKVFDAAGVQRYQEYPLAMGSTCASVTVETARILKPDGKVQKVEADGIDKILSFPSLAPGDVIDVAYRIEDHRHGALARQFWTQWSLDLPDVPVKLSRHVLITPPDLKLRIQTNGPVAAPAVREVKGWLVREWRTTDLPAGKQEMVPWEESGRWISLSTIPSWRHIAEWYRDLAGPLCRPDAAIRRKAEELTRNANTAEEKLRAIMAFVAREIRYQSVPFRMSAHVPTEGRQVLRERYGDCKDKAALLTALLAAVGIRSEMVLLNPRSEGITPPLPSPCFTHVVTRIETSRGPLWVDATADQLSFGDFPSECQQVPALVIHDETTDLTLTPALPYERNSAVAAHTGILGADGSLAGNLELKLSGELASLVRSALLQVPETRRDDALRAMAAQVVESAQYESGAMEHVADPDQPLTIRLQYRAERFGTGAGDLLLVRLPWRWIQRGTLEALSPGTSRQHDLEVAALRGHFASSVRLELPPGCAPRELPPEVRRETPWSSLRISYRMEGSVLHADCDVRIKALRVPAQEADEFIASMSAIDEELRKPIAFRKP